MGTNLSDRLTGVKVNSEEPGEEEIDRLTGNGGADLFVLGSSTKVFYDDRKSNSRGLEDYARITDFNIAQGDQIQLKGNASQYSLGSSPLNNVAGTAIFLTAGQRKPELIAIVQGSTPTLLTAGYFSYV